MLLDSDQIEKKVMRLVYEIAENNYDEQKLIIAGINNRGMQLAKLLEAGLKKVSRVPLELIQLRLSPADPLGNDIQMSVPVSELEGQVVLIVDDVANTGRTLFYACKPIMEVLPKKIEIAVLVDRKHKSFPIRVDYMGITLATTLQENIDVQFESTDKVAVYLD